MARMVLARSARTQILDLPDPLAQAILDALGMLEREPRAGHRLRGRLTGLRSLRVGAYRVVYELRDAEKTVRVVAVRHPAVAYRSDPR